MTPQGKHFRRENRKKICLLTENVHFNVLEKKMFFTFLDYPIDYRYVETK